MEIELDHYLEQTIEKETEPLLWQQAHSSEFSVLNDIARDYLTIQATSIALKQAFLIAENAITKTQNRLLSEIARAYCVKSWIDNNLIK